MLSEIKISVSVNGTYLPMQELKLLEYRETNRQRGWRATADHIGSHILTMTTDPLDLDVVFYSKEWLAHSPKDRSKYKQAETFFRRIQEAMSIVLYSFDDSPEDCVAIMQHLVHHYKLFDCYRKNTYNWQLLHNFIKHPIWDLWVDITGTYPIDSDNDFIDSRFY